MAPHWDDLLAWARADRPLLGLCLGMQLSFIPLTVGGGVSHFDHFRDLLQAGADKAGVNSAAVADPTLLTRAAERFGGQCVARLVRRGRPGRGRPPGRYTVTLLDDGDKRMKKLGAELAELLRALHIGGDESVVEEAADLVTTRPSRSGRAATRPPSSRPGWWHAADIAARVRAPPWTSCAEATLTPVVSDCRRLARLPEAT